MGMYGQSVQPVLEEYQGQGEGRFAVTNNTIEPVVVVLEPRSFSIGPDGHGTFRDLDANIHVDLSAMTLRLQPQQTSYVFYKASAKALPAWFTIYSSFSPVQRTSSISVQIQLPHTVYLYQKKPLQQSSILVGRTYYSEATHKLICEMKNTGAELGRVTEVRVAGSHGPASSFAGFPLLPGAVRKLEVEWPGVTPPSEVTLVFEHFTLKPQITREAEAVLVEPSSNTSAKTAGVQPMDPPGHPQR